MKKQLNIPKFNNEDQEREFWSTINVADYFEPSDFHKRSDDMLNIKLPRNLLIRLKQKAAVIKTSYESLITRYIEQGLASH